MKKILATALALSLTLGTVALPAAESGTFLKGVTISASAEDALTYGDFNYKLLDNGTVEISKYNGSDEIVTIPSTINGKKVTSIGERAFWGCKSLTSLTLPSSITKIGNATFCNCYNLTNITMPNGLTEIDQFAFYYCKKLKDVSIPNSVTKIGDNAFYSCESLSSIVLPSKIKELNKGVFGWCTSLTEVTLNNGLTKIGEQAFLNCNSLKTIAIPDSVTEICDEAFRTCYSLEEFTIPRNVTKIGSCVFTFGNSLMKLKVDKANPAYSVYDGNLYNKDKTKLIFIFDNRSLKLPKTLTDIDSNTFAYKGIRVLSIEEGSDNFVVEKGYLYNKDKTELFLANCVWNHFNSNCVISDGVKKIRAWAANANAAPYYTKAYIPSSVEEVEDNAFWQSEIKDIYYEGSEEEWKSIKVSPDRYDGNICFYTADVHFNHTHSYSLSDYVEEAGCDYDGNKYYVCECGDWYTETIPAKGHTIVTDKAVPATCTKAGKTEGSRCSTCDAIIKPQAVIKAKGHRSSAWITDKAAAIGVKGKKHKECTVCKTVIETADIPALEKPSISKASVKLSTSTYTYNGKAKKPSVTVKRNGKTLKSGTDYSVTYSNNKKVGTAKVTIKGKGNYSGTIAKTFKINPAKQEIQKLTAKSKAFFVDWAQKGSATGYEIQYATNSKFTSAKKVTITNNKTDKTTVSKLSGKKKYYVRVRSYTTVKGTKYYGAWSATKTVTTKK